MPRFQRPSGGYVGEGAAAARSFGSPGRRRASGSTAASGILALVLLAVAPFGAVGEGGAAGAPLTAQRAGADSRDPAEAVMVTAGRWALERLPSGTAALDPHRSGAGKDGARIKRVASALGMELTTLDQAKQCSDVLEPSTCQLGPVRLLAIGAPRVQGNEAEVKIYAWHRSDSGETPIAEKTWDLSLRREAAGWVVASGG